MSDVTVSTVAGTVLLPSLDSGSVGRRPRTGLLGGDGARRAINVAWLSPENLFIRRFHSPRVRTISNTLIDTLTRMQEYHGDEEKGALSPAILLCVPRAR